MLSIRPGSRLRFLAIAALVVALLGAGLVGRALAQTPPPSPSPEAKRERKPPRLPQQYDAFLNNLAHRLGTDASTLRHAIVASQQDLVQQAVMEGRLTQQKADTLKRRIEETGGGLFFARPAPHAHRPHGKHAPDHKPAPGKHGKSFGHLVKGGIQATADYLGLTPRELMQQLRQGKSLAQIASERGKTREGLKHLLINRLQDHVNQAVQHGRLTQEQGTAIVQKFAERVDRLIDRSFAPAKAPKDI